MSKITLPDTLSGYNLSVINQNFQAIADELNNKVLYRADPAGEPNQMGNNLDMNGFRILNLPKPVSLNEPARLQDLIDAATGGGGTVPTTASNVILEPVGNVTATDVQAGIQQLDSFITTEATTRQTADTTILNSLISLAYPVNTMAQLKAIDSTKHQFIMMLGYYTANDSGGGLFTLQIGDTTTADNGGTLIVAADGGRWKRYQKSTEFVNALCFGCKFDGATDDTANLQKAMTACKYLEAPEGLCKLTGPLQMQTSGKFRGPGMLKLRLQRYGNWNGNTITVGTATNSAQALDCEITDMLLEQIHPGFVIGTSTTMVDQQTGGQAHIACYGGYNCLFQNLWFQHGQFGLKLMGCVKAKVFDIHSYGSWDNKTPAVSEQLAAIHLTQDQTIASFRFNTEVRCERLYIGGGGPSAARTITIGSTTYTDYENIGAKYGMQVEGCEGLEVVDSYIGGCGMDEIAFFPFGLVTMVNLTNVFFDECYNISVNFYPVTGSAVTNVVINACKFNAQLHAKQAINCFNNAGAASVTNLTVSNCLILNHLKTPIYILGGTFVLIADNIVGGYNSKGDTSGTADICSGAYVDQASGQVYFDGGVWGGGVNGGGTGHGKWAVVFNSSSLGAAANVRFIAGLSGGAAVAGVTQSYPT